MRLNPLLACRRLFVGPAGKQVEIQKVKQSKVEVFLASSTRRVRTNPDSEAKNHRSRDSETKIPDSETKNHRFRTS